MLRILRDKGNFGIVRVHYEIFDNKSSRLLVNSTDFRSNKGFVLFGDGMRRTNLELQPYVDGVPEYMEVFKVRLVSVTGGASADQQGALTTERDALEITLQVPENDDPSGILGFASSSLSSRVVEDYLPGTVHVQCAHRDANRPIYCAF